MRKAANLGRARNPIATSSSGSRTLGARLARLRVRHRRLARRRHVVCVPSLQDLYGAFLFVAVVDVDCHEQIATAYFAFVALGFDLRDAHADERAGNAAERSTGCGSAE